MPQSLVEIFPENSSSDDSELINADDVEDDVVDDITDEVFEDPFDD